MEKNETKKTKITSGLNKSVLFKHEETSRKQFKQVKTLITSVS